jgi:hypothetical protein
MCWRSSILFSHNESTVSIRSFYIIVIISRRLSEISQKIDFERVWNFQIVNFVFRFDEKHKFPKTNISERSKGEMNIHFLSTNCYDTVGGIIDEFEPRLGLEYIVEFSVKSFSSSWANENPWMSNKCIYLKFK